MLEAIIDIGAICTSTASTATAGEQDGQGGPEEHRGAAELLEKQSDDDACSVCLSGANSYGASAAAESEHGSTQFDGASVDWSDTVSYASDTDGDKISNYGDSGHHRCARASHTCTDASSSRRAEGRESRAENGLGRRRRIRNRDERCAGDAATTASAASARRRRKKRGEGGAGGGGGNASEDGYAEDIDSTSSMSDAGAGDDSDDSSGSAEDSGEDSGEGDGDDPLEPIPGEVKLVPSMFPDRPPTVFFEYPKELGMARFNNVYFSEPLGARRLLFKSHWERNSVKNAFFRAGFSRTKSTMSWTASWGKHPTREGFRNLNRFQKVNHFPGSWCIGRKDRLTRTLARHKREIAGAAAAAATAAAAAAAASGSTPKVGGGGGGGGGSGGGSTSAGPRLGAGMDGDPVDRSSIGNPVDITPDGFVLPADRRAWLKAVEAEPKAIWIVKPPASSCGRGIRVINKSGVGSVSKTKKGLVQRYIHNPMLIDGRKFDLRLYVLVTSMEPLRVYLFEEGLVRFSTKRYSLKNLRSRYTHLTNYSINKKSGSFQAPEDSDGQEAKESTTASKWALTFFWKYLEETLGKNKSDEVQRSIEDVVLRTMVAADGDMTTHSHQFTRHRGCCYELFGFDVLLDEHLKPWLLEVNISPSLFGSSALDRRIKGTLMADIFHLVGFRPFDRMALRREERREAKHIPGTRRAIRAVAGRPQDAWRRCQTPASINLTELGEEEWEVIRDTEDEQHRAGHFRILYPTAENVKRLWPIFRSPRFLNGVLARWVSGGGLSNPRNRQDIGLIAERLATLTEAHYGKGMKGSGSVSLATGRSKARGLGLDGRWDETTSNATTIVSTGGRGGARRLGLGELSGAPQWPEGERPASSATSRASRPSATRRPLWRAAAATSTQAKAANGAQSYQQQQQQGSEGRTASGTRGSGKKPAKLAAPGGRGAAPEEGGRSGGYSEKSSGVPRLQLRRVPSRVAVAPSLLTLQTPVVSARRFVGGAGTNGSSRGGNSTATPRPRRVSSATSRPSSASVCRSSSSGGSRGNSVATPLEANQLNVGHLHAVGEKWGLHALAAHAPSDLAATMATAKQTRDTPRRRSPRQHPERAAEQGCTAPLNRNTASNPKQRADRNLRPCGTDALSSERVLPSSTAGTADLDCFPRPPCRAANHHAPEAALSSDEDPFADGQLPYRYSGLTSSTKGMASRRSLSRVSLRSRATTLTDSSGLSGSRAISAASMGTHGATCNVEPMSNDKLRGNAATMKEKLFPAATAVRGPFREAADGVSPRNRTGRKGQAIEDHGLQFLGVSASLSREQHGAKGPFTEPSFKPFAAYTIVDGDAKDN